MRTVATVAEVRAWRGACTGRVGLVPTMGYLHEGHRSLVERARAECDHVAATIFVNPTQFAPHEDLDRYPRDLGRDTALLEGAGCDLLFTPAREEVYPAGFDTLVEVGTTAGPLEGAHRPGHFRGVATVVLKLFGMVQPHRAYFGQKDAQQLGVIRRMVRDLDVPVEIVGCATVREPDGLARSSRNSYLGPQDRAAAPVLFRALQGARALFERGERDAEVLRKEMRDVLARESRASVDYVSVAHPETFVELSRVEDRALFSMAVRVGPARLIDNVTVGG
jgi:pantoate--beta-alanine ligase